MENQAQTKPQKKPTNKSMVYEAVNKRIETLKNISKQSPPAVRRILAELRRGLGKPIGEYGFSFVLEGLDESFLKNHDDEIEVIYEILTLFGKHQQSNDFPSNSMHEPKQRIGKAMQIYADKNNSESFKKSFGRRFEMLITSSDRTELLYHLRQMIALLDGIPFDYAELANDVFFFKFTEQRDKIRLKWGKDFYINNSKNTNEDNQTNQGE
jgi:CRISPR system Cascade subunit CasB